jgi:DNA-binding transcriptional LysR family regulator
MLDRITGLQVFAKVASLGSFTAAARSLAMSQSMATKHVDAIEARLGTRLLHRTTRRLSLTEAGQRYLESAERILAEIDEADQAAAETVEPRGTLRVAGPLSFGFREIAPALADFARLYPHVKVDFGLSDRIVDLVEEGWDLAIRIAALRDSALVARKLAPIRVMLCAAPAYLAARGTPRTTADLKDHNCLGYTLPTAANAGRWLFGADASLVVEVSGNLVASNGDALRMAALAGQGIIYQPTFLVADDLRAGRLHAIALDHPLPVFGNVHAVYAPSRYVPTKVRRFIDFLAERWSGVPPWDRA